MGPGCESCPSPPFIEWKKEFDYQKKIKHAKEEKNNVDVINL
jgi:hypothetical protein